MTGAVAVLDFGKTTSRLALFDASGAALESWSTQTPTRTDGPYPAEDADALMSFLTGALREAAMRAPIDALVPVAHGAAGALVNEDDLALPILDYEHHGPEEIAERYDRLRPLFFETRSPRLPNGLNLGAQLAWQMTRFPEQAAQARWFLTLPQYWAWRLCGVAASEATGLGAHTDLWAPEAGRFSSLIPHAGWSRLFPRMRRAWERLGPVKPAIAARTGLSPDTQVLCGVHDSNASLLPHLAGRTAPFAVVSTGTWGIVMHVGGDPSRLSEAADMLANVDANARATPSARFMAGREFAAISRDDAPATMEAAAAVVESGALAIPAFSDQGGPWRRHCGRIEGELPEMQGARSALASLYAALVTDDLLDRLGVTGDVAADGPFAANPVWLGALASLRAPASVFATEDGGPAAGAALLARWGSARRGAPGRAASPAAFDLSRYRARWRAHLPKA